ncbi:MAG: MFS transporter [Thermodesulfobacteriota bacterium]
MRNAFDGWRIVAIAGMCQALGFGLLSGYGFLVTPLAEEFGASTAQLGFGFSISIMLSALVGPLLGRLLDTGPLRAIMLAGVVLMLLSMLLLSRGVTLTQLGLCFAVTSVGMSMYGPFPAQVMIVNWFFRRRGTALAWAAVGLSVASFVVPQVTARLVAAFGWRVAVAAIACGAALIALPPIALYAVKRPEDVGQHPDGVAPSGDAGGAPGLLEIPLARLVRDANFWLVGIGLSIALCVVLPTFFLVRYMERELGIPVVEAANVPSTIAACGLVGKLLGGWAMDRTDKRLVVAAALLLHALGWLLVAMQKTLAGMLLAAVPLGLGGGGFLALPAVLQAACFGRAMIGRVSGLHALIGLPFLLTIAPLVGWAEQRTGSFAQPFVGLAALLVAAAAVLVSVRFPKVEPGL